MPVNAPIDNHGLKETACTHLLQGIRHWRGGRVRITGKDAVLLHSQQHQRDANIEDRANYQLCDDSEGNVFLRIFSASSAIRERSTT